MSWALLVEVYRDYDMKFEASITELKKTLFEPASPARKQATTADEAASMVMLQTMMKQSDFRGPKG